MGKKNTLLQYEDLASKRNLKIIELKDYKNVHESKITLQCLVCQSTFTTSCNSFLSARKTGCPTCKKTSIRQNNKMRSLTPPRRRKKKKPKPLAPEFSNVNSRESLMEFLEKTPNPYNDFYA